MVARAAQIQKGRVVNIIVVNDEFNRKTWDGLPVVLSDDAAIGDLWDGVKFTSPPPAPDPAPSRRQQLATKPALTPDEIQEALKLLLEQSG